MSRFGGTSSAVVGAPPAVCFQLVCDTARTPDWQQAVSAVEVIERDRDGRSSLVRANIDALVARVNVDLRITYEQDRAVHMERESGDLRHLVVTWMFHEIGSARTQADFRIEFDPGRILSALARGPVPASLEALLAEQPPQGLKRAAESPRTSA